MFLSLVSHFLFLNLWMDNFCLFHWEIWFTLDREVHLHFLLFKISRCSKLQHFATFHIFNLIHLKFLALKFRHSKYLRASFHYLKYLYKYLLEYLYYQIKIFLLHFQILFCFTLLEDFQSKCFKCSQLFALPLVLHWLCCYLIKSHLHWFHLNSGLLFHV